MRQYSKTNAYIRDVTYILMTIVKKSNSIDKTDAHFFVAHVRLETWFKFRLWSNK